MANLKPIEVVITQDDVNRVPVKIMLTHPDAKIPVYAKEGDAGADVCAVPNEDKIQARMWKWCTNQDGDYVEGTSADYMARPHETILINLGFKIELRPGWEMQVRSRSGMAKRGLVVANAPGTIDSGYRGPCMVLIRNENSSNRIIQAGARVAQFVLKRAPQADYVVVDELGSSERSEGGFGSTGTQ